MLRLLQLEPAGHSPSGLFRFSGVGKWSSRLAHNQQIVGSNPTSRNQFSRRTDEAKDRERKRFRGSCGGAA